MAENPGLDFVLAAGVEGQDDAAVLQLFDLLGRILSLLEQHPVTGQDIHDLHLAATMLSNGV